MRKFLIKLLLSCIPLLGFLFFMEITLRNIKNDYTYKNKYLQKHEKTIRNIILGSSHTYRGVTPHEFNSKTFNMANISQSLYFDNIILKKHIDLLPNLETIFLPISYFSLYQPPDVEEEKWRKYYYYIYMDINSDIIKWYDLKKFSIILAKGIKNSYTPFLEKILDQKDQIYCDSLGWNPIINTSNSFNNFLGEAAKRHDKYDINNFHKNKDIINCIIDEVKRKNVKLVLFTTPTYKTYYNELNSEKLENIISYCNSISNNINVFYFNYLSDNRFTKNDFINEDHLNKCGAIKFTRILLNDFKNK